MEDPVYKKPVPKPVSKTPLPSLEEILEKQCAELVELAQVRYGIKGSKVEVQLTPLLIHDRMSEKHLFSELSTYRIMSALTVFCMHSPKARSAHL